MTAATAHRRSPPQRAVAMPDDAYRLPLQDLRLISNGRIRRAIQEYEHTLASMRRHLGPKVSQGAQLIELELRRLYDEAERRGLHLAAEGSAD